MRRGYRIAICLLVIASILPASVAADAPPATLDGLRSELTGMISGWNGDYAVSVTDLQSGQSISSQRRAEQPAASTIKLFVAIAIAQQIDSGTIDQSDVDEPATHDGGER